MLEWRRQGEDSSTYRRSMRMSARRLAMSLLAVACVLAGPAAVSAAAAPVNGYPPEVVGIPKPGERLVCGAGSWSGSVSGFTYEWIRDGLAIASGVTYTAKVSDEGHFIWCIVTASGGEGSGQARSSNSLYIEGGPPQRPPEPIAPPAVSGTPALGQTLGCSSGTWSGTPAPTFTYQWVRDHGSAEEATLGSATASTYKVAGEDQGHSLTCKVTASNSAGSAAQFSNTVRVPGIKPEDETRPAVVGLEPSAPGEALTCTPGTWRGSPSPTFAYQWMRDGSPIGSATASTYVAQPADQLHVLSCKVSATNSEGKGEATSSNGVRVAGSAPQNTAPPHIAGTLAVGEALTCQKGTWTGLPEPTYTYLWVRDQGLSEEVTLGSGSTYTARTEDAGHSLSCEVFAKNSEGEASQGSERVVIPVNQGGKAPQNEGAPTASGGAALGQQLGCSTGTWSGTPSPTLTYQWLRDGSPIAAATGSSYVVAEADEGHSLSCRVTAMNDEGSASATSNVLEIPGEKPADVLAPQVPTKPPAVGESLPCSKGTWKGQPPPTFTYQWLRDGTSIPGATASSHTVTGEDRGHSLSCRVTAKNSAGTTEAISNAVKVPGNEPENLTLPAVSGVVAAGGTVTCLPGTWSGQPPPTYTYQWLVGGTEIPSATASTYEVPAALGGFRLSCRVTGSNREGSGSATSLSVNVPGIAPANVQPPQVSGTPTVGQQLTCLHGAWNGQPPPSFAYQWQRDGAVIPGATGTTYAVEPGDLGHVISCHVLATNTEGTGEAQSANGLTIVAPTIVTQVSPEPTFPPVTQPQSPATAEILASLRSQVARAQHRARISSIRKKGLYSFSLVIPVGGRLELFWYQDPRDAHHSSYTKRLVVALSTTSFGGAGTRTVKLRLTSAGRRLLEHSRRSVQLTLKGVFRPSGGHPLSWQKTVALHY
jgi:hypothetical protein